MACPHEAVEFVTTAMESQNCRCDRNGAYKMHKEWFCLNCYARTGLDLHGRCPGCGSEAVVAE